MKEAGNIYHLVFQTRDTGLAIPSLHRDGFFYMIARLFTNRRCLVYAVSGGMNHVHVITEIPYRKNMKTLIEKVKDSCSVRAAEALEIDRFGGWLKGYVSFVIDRCQLPFWVNCIEQQEMIHSDITWMQEKRQFMNYNLI